MKVSRHTKILEIIEKRDIETQEDLASTLKNEGYEVTQATISRDIRELKLTKVTSEQGKQKYSAISTSQIEVSQKQIRVLKDAVIKIDLAQNMIVIKTLSGMGMAVAVAIDNMENTRILGSIAGDDTIFCVARSNEQATEFIQKINKVINN